MAAANASIERDGDTLHLGGVLDFDSVPALARQLPALLGSTDAPACVDCARVSSANSAGLALLLEISRIMRASQRSIRFQNVPPSMQSVAHAYGLVEPDQELEAVL